MSKYETTAGNVTRGETYAKSLDLLDQILDQTAIMAHLHATEDTAKDRALADGWRAMHQMFRLIRAQITQLAKGQLN